MKLPSVPVLELPGGYRWVQHEVPMKVWQAHLLKHPLGVGALRRRQPLPWNHEGWDLIDPPAITEERRTRFAEEVSNMSFERRRCEVRELRGSRSSKPEPECYHCEPPLVVKCHQRLAEEATPARYAAETERLVRAVVDGAEVSRRLLTGRLLVALKQPDAWAGLVVMTVGRDGKDAVVRCSGADGTRAELYVGPQRQLGWRTTYRSAVAERPNERLSWVLDSPAPAPGLSLSEVFVVPRDWANRHGI